MNNGNVLTIAQLARSLGVTPAYARGLVSGAGVHVTTVGSCLCISEADYEAIRRRHTAAMKAAPFRVRNRTITDKVGA